MFVSVLFGEDRMEMFNVNCRIINFIHCLKERCDLDPQDSIDLMDRTGELVNLNDREQSVELASSLLKNRHSYILVRVSQGDGTKYAPLVSDLGKSHPELAEILRKLSNPSKERDKKIGPHRKGAVIQNRSKTNASPKKNHTTTPRS